jgi:tetratricopeptide (TPR) repeat protein
MYRTKAVIPIAEQDYGRAESLLKRAVEADEEDAQAWYYLGLVESRTGRYAAALKYLARAEALGFTHPDLFFQSGYAHLRLQQYPQASAFFAKAKTARPSHQPGNYYLGLSRLRQGVYEQAMPALQQAAAFAGDSGMAARYLLAEIDYRLGRKAEARAQLLRLLAQEDGSRFFSHQLFPLALLSPKRDPDIAVTDFIPALAMLEEALALDARDNRSRYHRGVLLSRSGDYRGAVAELEQAVQADYSHPDLLLELGIAYYRQGEDGKAIARLTRAESEASRTAASGYYLAAAHYRLEQYAQALSVLEATPTETPLSAQANDYLRAETLHRMQRNDEAGRVLQQMLAAQPGAAYSEKATVLLDKVKGRRDKTYQLEVSAGFLRDTNVGLYADDVVLPAGLEERADNRWQLALDGKWQPVIANETPLTFGYRFFQSLHQQLDRYDLRHHALSADWRRQYERLAWGVNFQYSVASLDDEDYVTSYQLLPNLLLQHGRKRASVMTFTWHNDTYDYPELSGYDGSRYQADYRHYWVPADSRYHYLGALLRKEDTDDVTNAYRAAGVQAGLMTHWQRIRIAADLQYQRKQYHDAVVSRDADYYKIDLNLSYPISSRISMDVSAGRIENRSDAVAFDYSRTLYGLTMRWQL